MKNMLRNLKKIIKRCMRPDRYREVGFEVTSKCNAKCVMCARADGEWGNKEMAFGIVEKAVEDVIRLGWRKVRFNFAGICEPLLYKDLARALRYVKEKLPYSEASMITNGIELTRNVSKELISNRLDSLFVSINAASREDYRSVCGVDKYDQVMENIKIFLSVRKELMAKTPRLVICLKAMDRTRERLDQARHYWAEALSPGDFVHVRKIRSFRDKIKPEALDSCFSMVPRYPCNLIWHQLKLDVDGNVYPCCGKVLHPDYRRKSELYLGNIYETSLDRIWHGELIKKIRLIHLQDEIEKLPTCMSCDAFADTENIWIRNRCVKFLRKKWL